jgi:hypothetical protein
VPASKDGVAYYLRKLGEPFRNRQLIVGAHVNSIRGGFTVAWSNTECPCGCPWKLGFSFSKLTVRPNAAVFLTFLICSSQVHFVCYIIIPLHH